jgi:hypothetical protein
MALGPLSTMLPLGSCSRTLLFSLSFAASPLGYGDAWTTVAASASRSAAASCFSAGAGVGGLAMLVLVLLLLLVLLLGESTDPLYGLVEIKRSLPRSVDETRLAMGFSASCAGQRK